MTRNDAGQARERNADLAAVTAELIATSRVLMRRATEAVAETQALRERRRTVHFGQDATVSDEDDSG